MCVCVCVCVYILADSTGENIENICMVITFRYSIKGSVDNLATIKIKKLLLCEKPLSSE